MKALLIVDVQNDFCTGGALATKGGEEVVPVINKIAAEFDIVVASKDWHPEETMHFEKWPNHCIQNTKGAEFHKDLDTSNIHQIAYKGTGTKDDGYSAFEATNINLTKYLQQNKITEVYVSGLATDYCVLNTALDSVKHNFKTFVITDAIRAVNVKSDDSEKALEKMKSAGCKLISSEVILS
ncbi:nicotinamidase [Galbibacter mesophilus]|uniref:nicotinamidase n=1 Tax=Galbibacter mesophilus TaxID=379069 RepID=UPI00191F6AAE|nr:nicotinamidase [Galbibacter mesophilus]MCM5662187.1 nicotinamidase [Galbibacter mesophilus]